MIQKTGKKKAYKIPRQLNYTGIRFVSQPIAPMTAPADSVAGVPETMLLNPGSRISEQRVGTAATSPPIMIPGEAKSANPQIAHVMIKREFNASSCGSEDNCRNAIIPITF